MKLFKAIFFFAILFFAFSCGDDEDPDGNSDTGGLEIIIHSPQNNATFNMGETIVLSYTVKHDEEISTIAWDTKSEFGTGSVPGSEFLNTVTEYSGEFMIIADASPGTYEISINATDKDFEHVLSKSVTVIIQ